MEYGGRCRDSQLYTCDHGRNLYFKCVHSTYTSYLSRKMTSQLCSVLFCTIQHKPDVIFLMMSIGVSLLIAFSMILSGIVFQ